MNSVDEEVDIAYGIETNLFIYLLYFYFSAVSDQITKQAQKIFDQIRKPRQCVMLQCKFADIAFSYLLYYIFAAM